MSDGSAAERSDIDVPEVVRGYLAAHDRRDTDAALASFTADARVLDDGHEYVGRDEIRHWIAEVSTEFTYTRTFVNATATDTNSWEVVNHLEGNFPGGVVDLRYRFVLRGDLISQLTVAP
jgi:hypothetical protein